MVRLGCAIGLVALALVGTSGCEKSQFDSGFHPGVLPKAPTPVSGTTTGGGTIGGTTLAAAKLVLNTALNLAHPRYLFDFLGRLVGASYSQTLTLTNVGGVVATKIKFVPPSAPFSVNSSACGASLAPQESCDVVVTYSPVTSGSVSGEVAIDYSNNGGPAANDTTYLDLNGRGENPAFVVADVNQESPRVFSHDYGSVLIGDFVDKTVKFTNIGDAAATNFSVVPPTVAFELRSNGCGALLASGASCSITVRFSPLVSGPASSEAKANYFDGSADQTALVKFKGSGRQRAKIIVQGAGVEENPAHPEYSKIYGSQFVNSSTTITFTLKNVGKAAASGIGFTNPAAPFFLENNTCPTKLDPDASCTLDIRFSPVQAGNFTGVTRVDYDDGVTSTFIRLTTLGTGVLKAALHVINAVPDPSFPTFLHAFLDTILGKDDRMDFEVKNLGDVEARAVSFKNPIGEFSVAANNCPPILDSGKSCQFTAVFAPVQRGLRTDRVQINYVDDLGSGTNTTTLNLKGLGLEPPAVTLDVTKTGPLSFLEDFGKKIFGSQTDKTITAKNEGDVAATDLAFRPPAAPFSFAQNNCGTTLEPGKSCTFVARAEPTSLGKAEGKGFIDYSYTGNPGAPRTTDLTLKVEGIRRAQLAVKPPATLDPADPNYGYDFGSVVQDPDALNQKLVLVNNGDVSAAAIEYLDPAAPFSIVNNSCGVTLGAAEECSFTVRLDRSAAGTPAGQFRINYANDSGGSPNSSTFLNLRATILSPAKLTLNTAPNPKHPEYLFAFDPTDQLTTASKTLTLKNEGQVRATLIQFTSPQAPFGLGSNGCPTELDPNKTCDFVVTFTPNQVPEVTGQLGVDYSNNLGAARNDRTILTLKGSGKDASPKLVLEGASLQLEGPCKEIAVVSKNFDGTERPVPADLPVQLSGQGGGAFYSTLSDCHRDTKTTSVTIRKGKSKEVFLYQGWVPAGLSEENVTLKAIATGYTEGSLPVQVRKVPSTPARGFNGTVFAVKKASDGKIYVGGDFTTFFPPNSSVSFSANRIARFNSDGSFDSTYLTATRDGFNGPVYALEIASDGKLYVGGGFTTFTASGATANVYRLARLNPDGTLDGTFLASNTGFNVGTLSSSVAVRALLLASGGARIYVGGNFTSYTRTPGTTPSVILSLVLLTTDTAAIDSVFLRPNEGFSGGTVYALALAGGQTGIYVGGEFSSYTKSGSSFSLLNLVNLLPNGTINTGFLAPSRGPNTIVYTITISAQGIIVGGAFTSILQNNGQAVNTRGLARLSTTGIVDTAFIGNNQGFNVVTSISALPTAIVYSAALLPDGSQRLLVGGSFSTYTKSGGATVANQVILLDSTGSPVTVFSTGQGFNRPVQTVLPLLSGQEVFSFLGGSFTAYDGTGVNRLALVDSTAKLNTTFNSESGLDSSVYTIFLPSDGSLLAGGTVTRFNGGQAEGLGRLTEESKLDTAFNANGFTFSSGATVLPGQIHAVATPKGDETKYYVGGRFNFYKGNSANHLLRLDAQGNLDTSFPTGGRSGANSTVRVIVPTKNNSIYVGGDFTGYNAATANRFTRVRQDGSIDTFSVTPSFNGTRVQAIATAPDGSGDVYVGGTFTTYRGQNYAGFIKLEFSGAVPSNFPQGGGFTNDTDVRAIAVTGDGNFVFVGGNFREFSRVKDKENVNYLVKLRTSDFTLDTSFNSAPLFNRPVNALALSASGQRLYVAGEFTTYKGIPVGYVVRLRLDGSLDTSFSTVGAFNLIPYALGVLYDGSRRIWIGGQFTSYGSITTDALVRLLESGALN